MITMALIGKVRAMRLRDGKSVSEIARLTSLARNPLKGSLGDAIHAVLCGAGHNLRLLIARMRLDAAAMVRRAAATA
jgi:hypothetical protein